MIELLTLAAVSLVFGLFAGLGFAVALGLLDAFDRLRHRNGGL